MSGQDLYVDTYNRKLLHVRHERREIAQVTTARAPSRIITRLHDSLRDAAYHNSPVVGLRERGLLVSKQPSVAVGGVYDVHVAPDERPSGRSQVRLRERAPFVSVRVRVAVFVLFAGTCAHCDHREREGQKGLELHPGRKSRGVKAPTVGGSRDDASIALDTLGTYTCRAGRP